jgi:hypothetical protein
VKSRHNPAKGETMPKSSDLHGLALDHAQALSALWKHLTLEEQQQLRATLASCWQGVDISKAPRDSFVPRRYRGVRQSSLIRSRIENRRRT